MPYELYTTKHWMILPSFVHGLLPTLMHNSNSHIALGIINKKRPYLTLGGGDVIRDSQVTEDGEVVPRYDGWDGTNMLKRMKEPFVNVIPIDGPITRNGDACSYGSKDIRDWMMEATANKYCRAHVLVVNTPGGSAWAKNDFQQAIDFAHDHGQRVYMVIDGLCASAGMYLASFCDEVYVVNLKDQLGCVGVMASFFTMANGEKMYTNETYREYYATRSVNKNKEMRDIANDDDATLLIGELDELEAEFREDMQRSFPNATDEHLDGKVFYADEVMGTLCDGQMMTGEVVARAFAVANGEEQPIERTANRNVGQPEDVPADEPGTPDNDTQETNISPKNNSTIMTNKYQNIAQLLGVEELQVTEEGTFLNAPLLDTLSEKLTELQNAAQQPAAQQEETPAVEQPAAEAPAEAPAATDAPAEEAAPAAEAAGDAQEEQPAEEAPAAEEETPAEQPAEETPAEEEQPAEEAAPAEETPAEQPAAEQPSEEVIENAIEDIDKVTETLHTAEQMIEEKDATIANLKAEAEGKDNSIEQLQQTLDGARHDIEAANATIAARDKSIEEKDALIAQLKGQVADLRAEVKELAGKPAPMTDANAGVPQDNGTGEAPQQHQQGITSDMDYKEIREFRKKQAAERAARKKQG